MAMAQGRAAALDELGDGDLIAQAQRGDRASLDELVRRHRQSAFVFALQLLGNREDALDVCQDSLLRFVTNLQRFDSDRPVLPWLRRIVRNRAIDLRRRGKVRRASSLDSDGLDGETIEIVDPKADSGDASELRERQRIVWRALASLSESQREILVLRDYQDLSYQEIADVLTVPIGTVMSRLHRARAELRRQILAVHGPLVSR